MKLKELRAKHEDKLKKKKDTTAEEETRQELLAYYSTPEGREQIRRSVHRDRTVEEIVEDVMRDVYNITADYRKKEKGK